MSRSGEPDIRTYPHPAALAESAAAEVVRLAAESIAERGRFIVSLSGGSTPRALYECLARDHGNAIDWARVRLFWGDERCVPPDHPMSNFRMAREALLDHVPLPPGNVHRLPAERTPAEAVAAGYEHEIASVMGAAASGPPPVLDLVLLGMGADGHTASLFPGDAAFAERERWVMPALAPESYDPRQRISFTLPLINNARRVMFVITGADKRETLRAVLRDPRGQGARFPAAHVRPVGHLTWMVDAAAAEQRPFGQDVGA